MKSHTHLNRSVCGAEMNCMVLKKVPSKTMFASFRLEIVRALCPIKLLNVPLSCSLPKFRNLSNSSHRPIVWSAKRRSIDLRHNTRLQISCTESSAICSHYWSKAIQHQPYPTSPSGMQHAACTRETNRLLLDDDAVSTVHSGFSLKSIASTGARCGFATQRYL